MATKYPKQIGLCIDMLYEQRAKRLAASKVVDDMKKAEAELEGFIINTFDKQELQGSKGNVATASIKHTTSVNVEDWDAFVAYVAKTKDWSLLQKHAASEATKERWADGLEIPGLVPFTKISLSLTKA